MLQFSDSEPASLQGKSHTFDQPVTASSRERVQADADQREVDYRFRGHGHSNLVCCARPRDVKITDVHLASESGRSNGDQGETVTADTAESDQQCGVVNFRAPQCGYLSDVRAEDEIVVRVPPAAYPRHSTHSHADSCRDPGILSA